MSHQPRYTYLATDLSTGAIRDEIPFSEVSFSRRLNDVGTFNGTVILDTSKNGSYSAVRRSVLSEGDTGIWVLRDGVPVWGGILWAFRADLTTRRVSFAGQDFLSYFKKRVLLTNKVYTADDQFSIVDDLVTWAQSNPNGDIGMTVSWSALSGVLRDRTYYWKEGGYTILELIENLAAVEDGFEFGLEYSGSQSAGFNHDLRLSYPRRGRNTGVVIDPRKNAQLLSWSSQADQMINSLYGFGAGDVTTPNASAISEVQTDAVSLTQYLLFEEIRTWSDVSRIATLSGHVAETLSRLKYPLQHLTVAVRHDDPDAGLGTLITGDTVRVKADDGFISIDTDWRVVSINVTISSEGSEVVEYELVEARVT